jgi:hypothetical protein
MALRGRHTHSSGIEVAEAYIRVSSIAIYPDEKTVRFHLSVYKDKQARNEGLPAFESFENALYGQDFDLFNTEKLDEPNMNAIRQVYLYLKEQPNYADMIDDI